MTVYWAWHLTHVFFCLTQFGVKMISFALRAIKVAVTMREVIGWSSAKDVIRILDRHGVFYRWC